LSETRQSLKQREQADRAFYSRLLEANDFVSLLLGDEEPLTEQQIKKAFMMACPELGKKFLRKFREGDEEPGVALFGDQEIITTRKQ
jgi:hypothetical protein